VTREAVVARLLERRATGAAIVVAGVGSGLTASAAAAGGADLIATYGTAVYRILGVPTALAFLPYDDANKLTLDLLPEIVERSGGAPVVAGLGAHDPRRSIEMPGNCAWPPAACTIVVPASVPPEGLLPIWSWIAVVDEVTAWFSASRTSTVTGGPDGS